jgi:uncharacterized protein YdeI (YjbR/CyaY-like superfamily)
MSEPTDLPLMAFATAEEFRAWLTEHHDDRGIWLKLARKDSGLPSVSYVEAVEVALCFGWIDGQARSLEGVYRMQRFTPRRPRSIWSKINRARAEALIAKGLMHPAGLRQVEAAKADGRWEAAYDSPSTATVPPDLQAALDADPPAREFFATLSATNRYAILHRVQTAVKPETRARRIQKYVAMLAAHEKIYP